MLRVPARVERLLRHGGCPGDRRPESSWRRRPCVERGTCRSASPSSSAWAPLDPTTATACSPCSLLAPVVPVLGVALAFGPQADPMYEVQLATPVRGVRLIAIRASTVLATSIVAIGALVVVDPDTRPLAAAWLLPALALTVASLAAMTVVTPRRAASLVATSWFVVVSVARGVAADGLVTFGPAGQLLASVVAVVGGVVITVRRTKFDRLEYA